MAVRGRPPKPLSVLQLQGTDRKERHASRAEEPQSGGRPQCPKWLTGEGRKFWRWCMPKLERMGVAQSIDSAELAQLCRWWAEWRRLDKRLQDLPDDADAYKLLIQAGLAWKNFDKAAQQFGFTPVARTRLGKPKDDDAANPLLEMLRKRSSDN